MISEILKAAMPTLFIIAILFVVIKTVWDLDINPMLKSFAGGVIIVLPAIFTLKGCAVFLSLILPGIPSGLFFLILSVINEELYKLLAIYLFSDQTKRSVLSLLTGSGFALAETIYLFTGMEDIAAIRSITSLPLHVVTALILSYQFSGKKYMILLSILVHLTYNIVISGF